MKIVPFARVLVLSAFLLNCSKSGDSTPQPALPVTVNTVAVESITGTNTGFALASRKGFINVADGVAYSLTEAITNSDKVDFAYNYHGLGCSTCRFFENMKQMSTRTNFVSQFSVITASTIQNVGNYNQFTVAAFDSIATQADFDKITQRYKVNFVQGSGSADVTDRKTDVATGQVFAFKDKTGRLGLFKISPYTANVPTGDRAPLTLTIKLR